MSGIDPGAAACCGCQFACWAIPDDQVCRHEDIAETTILAEGGRKDERDGQILYVIPPNR
jgi:hypothetical protein